MVRVLSLRLRDSDNAVIGELREKNLLLTQAYEELKTAQEQIIAGCRCAAEAGADFVKTSTGFHPAGGATVDAVRVLRAHAASAKLAGVTDQQIEELRFYQSSPAFDEKERATIRFADLVTRGAAAIDASVLNWLGRFYSDDEIVELVMVIGLANMVNRFNDTLQIEPDLG